MNVGTVKLLYRYPVKSFQGESCAELAVDFRGAQGDRLYAVTTAVGKLGSGKNTRRFQKIDNLFDFSATCQNGELHLTFPDGRVVAAADESVDADLSRVLGQPLTLKRETEVSHFDGSPIHIVTTSSLRWLAEKLPQAAIDPRRFRPNFVIETGAVGPVEQSWIGKTMSLGGVAVEITSGTVRCVMTTLRQADLPRDPKILRCIAGELELVFGVYAKVLRAGVVRTNDLVTLDLQ